MQFKVLLLAASAALVSATVPTTFAPSSNPISKPSLGELVPVGSPYTITWAPTTSGTVSIQLLQGPSTNVLPLGPQLVQGWANTGTYSWTPSADLAPDVTHYGLQIISDADGTFQYSVQFGISNPSYSSASGSASAGTSATAVKNVTSAAPTSMAYSTGALPANSSILSATGSMTVPSTLLTAAPSAAASSTVAGAATSAASTSAKPSSGAAVQVGMSFGGAVVALAGAVFAL